MGKVRKDFKMYAGDVFDAAAFGDWEVTMKTITLILGMLSILTATSVQAAPVCSTAELFAGNPSYEEPMDRASDGQGLLDNPPLAWRSLLFVDDKLVTDAGQEIWYTDLKAAKPVIKRLAGRENRSGQAIKPRWVLVRMLDSQTSPASLSKVMAASSVLTKPGTTSSWSKTHSVLIAQSRSWPAPRKPSKA